MISLQGNGWGHAICVEMAQTLALQLTSQLQGEVTVRPE
jgi:hypothetical protein